MSDTREKRLEQMVRRLLAVPQASPWFTRIPGEGASHHIDQWGGDGFTGLSLFDEAVALLNSPAARPSVVLTLEGGIIQSCEISNGVVDVEARDFDVEGSDCEDLPTDDNGNAFYRLEWSNG